MVHPSDVAAPLFAVSQAAQLKKLHFCLFFRRKKKSQEKSKGMLCDRRQVCAIKEELQRPVGQQGSESDLTLPASAADLNGGLALPICHCHVSFARRQHYIPSPELYAFCIKEDSLCDSALLYHAQPEPGDGPDALTWLSRSANRAFLSLIRESY